MRRGKTDYQAKNEHRIVCSGGGLVHAFHAFSKPSLKKAQKAVEQNNTDPIFLVDPVPGNRGCVPWYIEARLLTAWRVTSP